MHTSRPLLTTDRFRVEEVTQQFPGGKSRTRAIVRHGGAVAIIPMVDADHVCLINNYRGRLEKVSGTVVIPWPTLRSQRGL